jgi:UDP-2,3-diacylglucosamine pyrophosphatase LpxH
MLTDKRLTEAYSSAKLEYFDETSRYIIFSDCHRGDNSLSDEFARNQNIYLYAMNYYYSKGYVYVEAGDGDELWEYSKFSHIRLAHSDIFIALKKFFDEDRLIMLYGNHNMYLRDNNYVRKNYFYYYDEYTEKDCELFRGLVAYEGLIFKHKETGQEILTVHGHQGDAMNDHFWQGAMFMLRYFWRFMHIVGFKNPASPAKNVTKRHKIEKMYNKWIENHQMMLICGHTHRPKFPRAGELPYFNTGCCIHSRGITGIEIMGGQIMMVEWRIRADHEGVLKISRKVIRGPVPIEKYDFSRD